MTDEEKIRKEGVKLIEEFSKMLEKVPETEETHYVVDLKNATREDEGAVKHEEFPGNFRKIIPREEDGYVVAGKG